MTGSESVTDSPEKNTLPRVQGKQRTIKKGQLVLRRIGVGNVVPLHCALCVCALGVAQMLTVLYGTLVRQRSWWNLNVTGSSHVTHRGLDEWESSEICNRSEQALVTLGAFLPWSAWQMVYVAQSSINDNNIINHNNNDNTFQNVF